MEVAAANAFRDLYNKDLAPDPAGEAHLGHLQLRIAVGRDERLHPHLHAGFGTDRRRNELEAGHRHHSARQPHRADSDDAQRACRRKVRHPVSRCWCARRSACAARTFPPCCARWWPAAGSASRPGSAARRSIPCSGCCGPARRTARRMPWICFFAFWLLNMVVIWRGIETIKFLEGIGAPFMLGVGLLLLWWITRKAGGLGPVLQRSEQVSHHGRVHALLHSVAHRHGGILGHGGAEHPGFHALRAIAEGADARPGAGPAAGDDAVFVHRRRGDIGVGGAVRRSHLGPGGAAGPFSSSR